MKQPESRAVGLWDFKDNGCESPIQSFISHLQRKRVSHAIFHLLVFTEHEHLSRAALWCSTWPCPDSLEGDRMEQETSAQSSFVTRDVGSSPGHSRDAITSKQRRKFGREQE